MPKQVSEEWQLARRSVLPAAERCQRQFFFRERLPDSARNVNHAYALVEKQGTILDGTAPWETGSVSTGMSTIIGLTDGRYRMFYTTHVAESQMRIAVAESDDGLQWNRIPLGQEYVDNHDTNLIVFDNLPGDQSFAGQPQVLRTPDRGWRMYFWKHHDGHVRYLVATSRDGLSWQVTDIDAPVLYHPLDKAVAFDWAKGLAVQDTSAGDASDHRAEALALLTNDSTFVYYNDHLDRYECYTVWLMPAIPDRLVEVDNAPGVHRTIQRRLSRDGLCWSAPELVIKPDDRDPWDLQLYYLAVQWHEDWLIGSLGHYRVEDGQQTQDLELVFSRDGRTWERPVRGGFIPRAPGARDSMAICPPNAWIDLGERWLCLYSAGERAHNEPHDSPKKPGCIMGATFRKNRFVGLAADRTGGGFLSDPIFPGDGNITVDADIRGWLRAELCDAWGRKIKGHHLMDSDKIHGDSDAHALTWHGVGAKQYAHNCARIRFEFSDGIVYGVGF